jgi:hemolysin III
MGWAIIFVGDEFTAQVSMEIIFWVFLGGILYTIGAVFYIVKRIPYNHAIWHVFVVCGSVSHFISIYFYLLPEKMYLSN